MDDEGVDLIAFKPGRYVPVQVKTATLRRDYWLLSSFKSKLPHLEVRGEVLVHVLVIPAALGSFVFLIQGLSIGKGKGVNVIGGVLGGAAVIGVLGLIWTEPSRWVLDPVRYGLPTSEPILVMALALLGLVLGGVVGFFVGLLAGKRPVK